MSCRGVTLQTRAASAADSRRRERTSPSLAMSTRARTSRISVSATERRFFGSRSAMSRTATDGTQRPTGGGSDLRAGWCLERLAVGDLHGRMKTAQLAAFPVGPKTRDLDAQRRLHIAGLHRRSNGIFPAAR